MANGTVTFSDSWHGKQTGNMTNSHSRSQHPSAGCNACHANR